MIRVKNLPKTIKNKSTYLIENNKVNYFTHNLFKYPCKFIPEIPKWAILNYTKKGDYVLDPFSGSGTSLVEAFLNKRKPVGIDFDKLSELLCKTKTSVLNKKEIHLLKKNLNFFLNFNKKMKASLPKIINIDLWFNKKNLLDLSLLKRNIKNFYKKYPNKKIYNFLLVCFAAIIRKCSNADNVSPKPYVSKRIKKEPLDVRETFKGVFNKSLKSFNYNYPKKSYKCLFFTMDAKKISSLNFNNKIKLIVTSPPYINAFDYVRSLRLENCWLDYYNDESILEKKKEQIGTEFLNKNFHRNKLKKLDITNLDKLIKNVSFLDKKRAYIIQKFFEDIENCIIQFKKFLTKKGYFILVISESKIRGYRVPSQDFIKQIAQKHGFKFVNSFSYIIKNRYLRIPRSGKGGFMKKDFVLVMRN